MNKFRKHPINEFLHEFLDYLMVEVQMRAVWLDGLDQSRGDLPAISPRWCIVMILPWEPTVALL